MDLSEVGEFALRGVGGAHRAADRADGIAEITALHTISWAGIDEPVRDRAVETDALVDTGAVKFYLKSSLIRQLGLREIGEIKSRTMSDRSEIRKGDEQNRRCIG